MVGWKEKNAGVGACEGCPPKSDSACLMSYQLTCTEMFYFGFGDLVIDIYKLRDVL